ncbi:MAG: 50S ribosomal protein L11 methyltransferase [Christensenella sp.]|uniref:50S ribosomal protein L11 methyltransferase n=1 Tax=Christensenella sp. TaxID=1935934 RepID=UPI002B1FDCC0|nr:50S ribosomal protein L11 methyltransferase [Christensenella sp.]MEA5003130.1 50S ribosomal protein L11 methyltransferase [Christensenella sp.]
MDWLKISVFTQKEAEEIVTALLMEAGAHGVSIEGDNENCAKGGLPWDYLSDEVLKKVPFCVAAFFPCDGNEETVLEDIRRRIGDVRGMDLGLPLGTLEVTTGVVHEQDWENAWKAYFKPVKISDFFVIKPTWEDYEAKKDEIVIEIDPGMAFGTGNHETTRMCVHLLEEYMEPGMTVIDAGCGSGILSVAAAKLDAKKIYALDLDPVAVQVTGQNAALNGCGDVIDVHKSDLLAQVPQEEKADIVVANIIADVVISLNSVAKQYMKVGGMYICSGIIDTRLEDVRKSIEAEGYKVIQIIQDGEWRAIACKYRG